MMNYKFNLGIVATAIAVVVLAVTIVYAQENFLDGNLQNLRIEQENKLLVPLDKRDEVWNFLKSRFVDDQSFLESLDSGFTSYWNAEEFWDVYFDTPEFVFLEMQSGVRHRRRVNHTDPESEKSGRELVQIKINNLSDNPLDRGEIKYDTAADTQPRDPDDAHPLIGLVDPDQRADFKNQLSFFEIDPYEMKPILMVHDLRSRIYIDRDGAPFMSISFDEVDSGIWWAKAKFIEIEPELNEVAYTEADSETRAYMEEVRGQIVNEILAEFPNITEDLTPKYNKSFERIEDKLPFLRFLVKNNLHNAQGLALLIFSLVLTITVCVWLVLKLIKRTDKLNK